MRYRLTIEYDGRFFSGWQKQASTPTVQETLEEALFRLTQEHGMFYGAGRTDKGVHATGQVAHVDLAKPLSLDSLRRGLNFYLQDQPVVVLSADLAPPDFHARFSAKFRTYTYKILNRPSPPLLEKGRVWWVHRPLDVEAMREGAKFLEGHHDFSAFRAKDCQATLTKRTLDLLEVKPLGEHIFFHVRSKSFLHGQVRIMVGTLKAIGEGRLKPKEIKGMLESGLRSCSGPTAPPDGLYLVEVGY